MFFNFFSIFPSAVVFALSISLSTLKATNQEIIDLPNNKISLHQSTMTFSTEKLSHNDEKKINRGCTGIWNIQQNGIKIGQIKINDFKGWFDYNELYTNLDKKFQSNGNGTTAREILYKEIVTPLIGHTYCLPDKIINYKKDVEGRRLKLNGNFIIDEEVFTVKEEKFKGVYGSVASSHLQSLISQLKSGATIDSYYADDSKSKIDILFLTYPALSENESVLGSREIIRELKSLSPALVDPSTRQEALKKYWNLINNQEQSE